MSAGDSPKAHVCPVCDRGFGEAEDLRRHAEDTSHPQRFENWAAMEEARRAHKRERDHRNAERAVARRRRRRQGAAA